MSIDVSEVVFTSSRVPRAADLYRHGSMTAPPPCLVMGHGFSGAKGLARVDAERFAAGLAVLVFDYRHFGASGGQPRQLVDVGRQREGCHAAIAFARGRGEIDPERVAIWGTSLSGGHVLAVAADDPRLAAAVARAPLIDAWRTGRSRRQRLRRALTRGSLKLFLAAGRDRVHASLGRAPSLARVVGQPGEAAVSTDPQVREAFAALGGEAAGWRNAFAPRFLFALPRYAPGTAERARMPLLVRVADRNLEASPAFASWVVSRAPAGHLDVYLGPVRDQMIADQASFSRRPCACSTLRRWQRELHAHQFWKPRGRASGRSQNDGTRGSGPISG